MCNAKETCKNYAFQKSWGLKSMDLGVPLWMGSPEANLLGGSGGEIPQEQMKFQSMSKYEQV